MVAALRWLAFQLAACWAVVGHADEKSLRMALILPHGRWGKTTTLTAHSPQIYILGP